MEYRFLGASGLQLSALSLGAWVTVGRQIGEDATYECMKAAFDAGVNFFDNAEAYASGDAEVMVGRVIKRAGWKRSDLVISTKIFWGGKGPNDTGLSRKHIIEGVDAALRRMQVEYVDLVFCHRPDLHTPIEETVRAMNTVIEQGKAFYWGTSEWSAGQITEAVGIARREHLIPPQMEQPQYNMLHRDRVEREYAGLYERFGLGATIFSPLASGILTGKYNDGIPDGSRMALPEMTWLKDRLTPESLATTARLVEFAAELGVTPAQLAIAWCLKNPRVSTVITGASRAEQVRENVGALDAADRLTPDAMERIEEILQNRPEATPDYR